MMSPTEQMDGYIRPTIRIGNKVMFGPEVSICGGNHRTDITGRFMSDITDPEKRPEDDLA